MNFIHKRAAALPVISLMFGLAGAAQTTTGAIIGNISDPSGASISRASVIVVNSSTSVTNTTQTNASGEYSFLSLQPGTYTLMVTAAGFRETGSTILLSIDQTPAIDLRLSVSSSSEQVTVSVRSAGSIETQSHEIGDTLNGKTIEDLPAPGGLSFRLCNRPLRPYLESDFSARFRTA
jgi:Carboxypeptidase regulatory-like domain